LSSEAIFDVKLNNLYSGNIPVWINCIGLNINCAKVEKYTIYLYAAAFENSTIPRNARFVIGVITRWTLFFNSYRKSGVYFMPSD